MSSLTMKPNGDIPLPQELRDRYGFSPATPIRIIETPSGVLLVPLTAAPMSDELKRELAEWQLLGAQSWEMFEYADEGQ